MKIISNKECYVQGVDLENLVYNEKNIPSEIHSRICSKICNMSKSNEYIKITDPVLFEYLLSCDMLPNFDELNMKSFTELDVMILKLKAAIIDIDCRSTDSMNREDIAQSAIEYYKEKRKKEYMISQIIQMIQYKRKDSRVKFPNVPNPSLEPVSNGTLNANLSLDFDKVLIYDVDGKPITSDVDKNFCKISYEMLMHDELSEDVSDEELKSELSKDKKYLSIERQPKKVLDEKQKMMKKLLKRKIN